MRRQFSCLGLALAIVVSLLTVQAGQTLAVAPTSAPTILSPVDGSSVGSANPTLSWAAVAGAARYRVQVSTSAAFASTIYSADTYALKATPPTFLPFSTLYWRVAGMDSSSALGPYSVATFTKDVSVAPAPATPTNGQTLSFPTEPVIFSWQPVSGATSYTLLVDDASDFIGAASYSTVNLSFTLTDTQTFTMSDGVTPQSWWWEVRANFPTSQATAWSTAWHYQIVWPPAMAAPLLKSPANGALGVTETVFSWDPVPGAATYEIQVSPNGDWQNNTIIDATVDSTRYAPYPTLNNQSYYWRVRARATGSVANFGPWSTPPALQPGFLFTRGWPTRPVIVSPRWTGGAAPTPEVSTLELSWTPASASGAGWVDHASYYELWIGTDLNFSPNTYETCYTNHTTFTPYIRVLTTGEPGGCTIPASLSVGTTYYWRVRAIDAPKGVLGLWDMTSASDTQRFVYVPAGPNLSCGPASGSPVSTPLLCWSAVSGADQYQVTIVKHSGAVAVTTTTFALSYTPITALTPTDGPFWWHVEAVDGLGNHGLVASPGSWPTFSLIAPTTGPTLGLLTPSSGYVDVRMPSMTWQPYTGATYYKVKYGNVSGIFYVNPLSGTAQLPYAGFTYAGVPLTSGRWYWAVEAYDAVSLLQTSATRYFDIGSTSLGDWVIPWSQYTTPECVARTSARGCTPQLGDTQELKWQGDGKAGAYLVYVSKDVNFTNKNTADGYRVYETLQTSLTPSESWLDSQAGESYYWFVRPCLDWATLHCGPGPDTNAGLDNASAYRKKSPAVSGIYASTADNPPLTKSTIANQITFNWTDYIETSKVSPYPVSNVSSSRVTQEAKEYVFQASTAADFSSILETVHVDQTQYTPWSMTYPEGPIYWRVQALDGTGNPLTMSATGTVTKASPPVALTSPVAGAPVSGVPYFSWTPQNWAAKYTIEVYKNGDLNFNLSNRVLNKTTAIAAWSPTTALPGGVYAWRVQRIDVGSRVGAWSTGRTFTLHPAAPTLNTPADQAVLDGSNLYFTWLGITGAVSYQFQSSSSAGFGSTIESQTTVMTAWSPVRLYTSGVYFWRVNLLDASNNVLSTSSSRSFSVFSRATYRALTPTRILDSRNGTGGLSGPFSSHVARTFAVWGHGGVPSSATAVTGNLTVTQQTSLGFLSIGPVAQNNPTSSTLNFPLNDDRANAVTVALSGTGTLSITYAAPTSGPTAQVIFDVTGYFTPDNNGDTYQALNPTRLLDSRDGTGGLYGPFNSHIARTFQVTGGVVPLNATAVTGNLTVTGQTSLGFLFIGPAAQNNPTSSTLNFPLNDDRANAVNVALSGTGTLSITYAAPTSGPTANVIFDVTGYFTHDLSGAKYVPLNPTRILDSRDGTGGLSGPFSSHVARTFTVRGHGGVPSTATAITGNLTVTQQTNLGYLSIGPVAQNNPTSSTLNFPLNDDRANAVTVALSATGTLSITYAAPTSGKTAQVIFDVTGYFVP